MDVLGEPNIEFPLGETLSFESSDFSKGRFMRVTDGEGKTMFDIFQNPPGNSDEASYTLRLPQGREILLPSLDFRYAESLENVEFVITAQFDGNVKVYIDGYDSLQYEFLSHEQVTHSHQHIKKKDIPDFESPILVGVLPGGHHVALGSFRECGRSKYTTINEDAGGFGKRVIVVDGVGGHSYGHQISDFASRAFLSQDGTFEEAILAMYRSAQQYVTVFRSQRNSQIDDGIDEKYCLKIPSAALSAIDFAGNKLREFTVGDTYVKVVRGDQVVYRSKAHTLVEAEYTRMLNAGSPITWEEAYRRFSSFRILSSLLHNFPQDINKIKKHIGEFELQPGDRVVVGSDGALLPDEVLVRCVQDKSPADAVENLKVAKSSENLARGGDYYLDGTGLPPTRIFSNDNATWAVTVWE